MPAGVLSTNPPTVGASGCGDPRHCPPTHYPKSGGVSGHAPSTEGPRAVNSGASWGEFTSVPRVSYSGEHRGQSRETGTPAEFSGRVGTSAKCFAVGPTHYREGLQNSVCFTPLSLQLGTPYLSEARAGSSDGTKSRLPSEEGSHRTDPSSRHRVRVLQPLLHCSKKGWRAASDIRSKRAKSLGTNTEIQNVDDQQHRVTNTVRGLVCHDRSEGRILSHIHPSKSQEVPEIRLRGQGVSVQGSSVRPSALTPHVYQSSRRGFGSASATRHSYSQLP